MKNIVTTQPQALNYDVGFENPLHFNFSRQVNALLHLSCYFSLAALTLLLLVGMQQDLTSILKGVGAFWAGITALKSYRVRPWVQFFLGVVLFLATAHGLVYTSKWEGIMVTASYQLMGAAFLARYFSYRWVQFTLATITLLLYIFIFFGIVSIQPLQMAFKI